MTAITNNYIWFLISGGVLLMITIGYFAEKTNFGKKKIGENIKDLDENSGASLNQNVAGDAVTGNGIDQNLNMYIQPISELSEEKISVIPNTAVIENNNLQNNFVNPKSSFMNIDFNQGSAQNYNNVNNSASEASSEHSRIVDLTDDDIWKF